MMKEIIHFYSEFHKNTIPPFGQAARGFLTSKLTSHSVTTELANIKVACENYLPAYWVKR
jgi:hypothetical protein